MDVGNANSVVPIPKEDLWDDYYVNLHGAYNSMRSAFDDSGMSQDDIAAQLGCDKSLISRRLNGKENVTLKSLSFMGTAMGCRLTVTFVPYAQVGMTNHYFSTPLHTAATNVLNVSGTTTYSIATTPVGSTVMNQPKSGSESKLLEPA